MRQSIFTKYVGPTNNRGSRISVISSGGIRKMYPWDDGIDVELNHKTCAQKFAQHMKWAGVWHGGSSANGYVFVNTDMDCDKFTIYI